MTAFTVEDIARVVHAANIELQVITGDPVPSLPWHCEPEEIRETTIAGVRAVLAGATPEESHAEWCRNKAAQGWRRGDHKSEEARTHPCLVPYGDLPPEQRVKDAVFAAVVQAMSGQPSPASSFTEWGVFWGGEDPNDCAGWDVRDGYADAEEHRGWIVGAGVAHRTVTRGPWTVTVPAPPAERWSDEEIAEFRRWRESRHQDEADDEFLRDAATLDTDFTEANQ